MPRRIHPCYHWRQSEEGGSLCIQKERQCNIDGIHIVFNVLRRLCCLCVHKAPPVILWQWRLSPSALGWGFQKERPFLTSPSKLYLKIQNAGLKCESETTVYSVTQFAPAANGTLLFYFASGLSRNYFALPVCNYIYKHMQAIILLSPSLPSEWFHLIVIVCWLFKMYR